LLSGSKTFQERQKKKKKNHKKKNENHWLIALTSSCIVNLQLKQWRHRLEFSHKSKCHHEVQTYSQRKKKKKKKKKTKNGKTQKSTKIKWSRRNERIE
jgi:hypothetical protein